MTLKEVVDILKTERQCVERQDQPLACDRDCAHCDLLLPTEDVLKAYSMAIECIDRFVNGFAGETQSEDDCKSCEFYDKEDNRCKAVECWPFMDCDEPLPCEEKKKDEASGRYN